MSRTDEFETVEFHPSELAHLPSRDYAGKIGDIDFAPGGESDQRVKKIMETAKTEGIREPLEIRGPAQGASRYLHDGHHRYVAAKRLGIPIKVRGYYK